MNYTINTTKTAAVATDNYWLPVDENTPRGVKVLLLTQGDIATIGQYHPDASWVIAWCPLPRKVIEKPKAEPPKCVKCGDKLMSSFTNTCYACKQKADRAPCRITTDGVCEAMECFEDEQPKKPLSVLQIRDIRDTFDKDEPISLVAFARAIEAAHGIK